MMEKIQIKSCLQASLVDLDNPRSEGEPSIVISLSERADADPVSR